MERNPQTRMDVGPGFSGVSSPAMGESSHVGVTPTTSFLGTPGGYPGPDESLFELLKRSAHPGPMYTKSAAEHTTSARAYFPLFGTWELSSSPVQPMMPGSLSAGWELLYTPSPTVVRGFVGADPMGPKIPMPSPLRPPQTSVPGSTPPEP